MQQSPPRMVLLRMVLLMGENRLIIKSLVIQIPCLCSCTRPFSERYGTVARWLSIVPQQLEPFSELWIPNGLLTFAPTRIENYLPCMIPRCKALVYHLQDLIERVHRKKMDPVQCKGKNYLKEILAEHSCLGSAWYDVQRKMKSAYTADTA